MRTIDADALKETLKDLCSTSNNVIQRQIENSIYHGIVLQIIDNEPTVDAELVKHGQWEWEPGYVGTEARCSVCKRSPMGFYSLSKFQIGRLPEYPFCPKCGARMDGEEE